MPAADPVDVILRLQGIRSFLAGTREASVGIREMGVAAGQASAESNAAAASGGRLSGAMGLVRKAGRVGALALVGVGIEATKMATNFDQAMTMIHTQAGASTAEVDRLRGQVLALAKTSPQGPEELAKGLYHLESIGLRGSKAMDALKISAQGAAVGQADLEDTTTALGAAWLTNIKGAGNLRHVMGLLNATVGAGNMRMGDLVHALGTGILPAAKLAGLGIKDVMGALATLTDEGMPASSAMAQLGTALHFLYAPTEKAQKALESIGLTQFKLANDMRKKGLPAALGDLQKHLNAFSKDKSKQAAIITDIVPGGRGKVLLTLLNNLDRYRNKIKQIQGTSGHFNEAVRKQDETTANKLRVAWSSVQVSLVNLGHQLAPVAVVLAQGLAKIADGAGKLITGFQHLSKTKRIIIGVAIALGILAAAGGPVALVIGIIAGGAFLIIKHWKPISKFFQKLWHDVSTWAVNAWKLIMKETEPLRALVVAVFQRIAAVVRPIFSVLAAGWRVVVAAAQVAWRIVTAVVRAAVGPILQTMRGFWQGIKGIVNIIAGLLTGNFHRAWSGVKSIFRGAVNVLIGAVRLLTAPFRAVFSHIGSILGGFWNLAKRVASFMAGIFKTAFVIATTPIRIIAKIIGGALHGALDTVFGVILKVGHIVGGFFRGAWHAALSAVNAVKSAIDAVIGAAKTAFDALKSLNPFGGGGGHPLKGISPGMFHATGGVITSQYSVVGERGPELVQLPMGSRVYPHGQDPPMVRASAQRHAEPGEFHLPDVVVPVSIDGREVAKAVGKFTSDRRARR